MTALLPHMQVLPSFSMSVFWSGVPKFSSFSSSLGGYHYRAWNFVLHAHTHACVCMYVCMLYMYEYMFVNKHAGMHMNACKCWHHMSFSIIFHYYLQREGLSLTSELDPGFPGSTSWAPVLQMGCYACLDFLWVLERWTTNLHSKCFTHWTIDPTLEFWFWTACVGQTPYASVLYLWIVHRITWTH